jgi:hypothetical protein
VKRFIAMAVTAAFMFTLNISMSVSARAEDTLNLTGHWASAEFGGLDFVQTGSTFTAAWAGVSVAGSLSGYSASFSYWQGGSYAVCKDAQRGRGTFVVSDDGSSLSGQWANMDAKEPESGSFNAIRVGNQVGNPESAMPVVSTEEDLSQYYTEAVEGIDSLRVPLPPDLSGTGNPAGSEEVDTGKLPAGTDLETLQSVIKGLNQAISELASQVEQFTNAVLQAVDALRYPDLPTLELTQQP